MGADRWKGTAELFGEVKKMKKKKYFIPLLFIIALFTLTACGGSLHHHSVSDEENTQVNFEVYAKGYVIADTKKWKPMLSGYDEGCIITNEDEFEELEDRIGVALEEEVDFSEDMLFVQYERSFKGGDRVTTWDVVNIAYNDELLLVEFTTEDAVSVYPEEEEDFVGVYYIMKISKDEFPFEERDYFAYNNGDGAEDDKEPEKVIIDR